MQIKKWYVYISIAIAAIAMSACSVSKHASGKYQTLSQRAQLTLQWEEREYSMNSVVRVWRDELIVLSVQPMLGIEMLRVEADRDSVWAFDKMNRKCVALSYGEIGKQTGVKINYRGLQDLLSKPIAEGKKEHLSLTFHAGKREVKFACRFSNREYNSLQAPTRTKVERYKRVSLREILPI